MKSSWLKWLLYTLTVGCVVPTMLMVTQWLPPVCKICMISSWTTSYPSVLPRIWSCMESTGNSSVLCFIISWAACTILAVSNAPLKRISLSLWVRVLHHECSAMWNVLALDYHPLLICSVQRQAHCCLPIPWTFFPFVFLLQIGTISFLIFTCPLYFQASSW